MGFTGIDPEQARDLSEVVRQGATAADDLVSETKAILTLSELTSELPNQLVITGDEMETVGVVIAARADIAEGFVLDPEVLAVDVGLPVGVVEKAIAAFEEPDVEAASITPILDAVIDTRSKAELLRGAFLNMPPQGEDPELDKALLDLAVWLPKALEKDKISDKKASEYSEALQVLAGALGLKETSKTATKLGSFLDLDEDDRRVTEILGKKLFERIEKAFELDQRVAKAAGLPETKDIFNEYDRDTRPSGLFAKLLPRGEYDDDWKALDDILPAVLVGEAELPDDPEIQDLILEFAGAVGYGGSNIAKAIQHMRDERLVQKSLIPGDFEAIDGPVIVWNKEGMNTALLAGERNGVLTEQTRAVADMVAANVLVDVDGTGEAIELSDEQQQALVAAIVAQNGEDFVVESDNIKRQIVSALNVIGRKKTLDAQREYFAQAIEVFRSLAVVGSPAVTYRQLKDVVGDEVTDELSHKYLTARSEKATSKRPQFLALISHWGIPGGDKIKLKKRTFKFEFDDDGSLKKVKNKKVSKWKRFKRTIKAIGKGIWKEWKDNPWKYLFLGPAGLLPGANQLAEGFEDGDLGDIWDGTVDMTKSAATIAALVFPGTNAAAVASIASAGIGLIEAIDDKDPLSALANGFGFVGGAAGLVEGAQTIGTTANLIETGATLGSGVLGAVDAGIDLVDAIGDDDILAALGSGFSLLGNAATALSNGAEFANSANAALNGITITPEAIGGLLADGLAPEVIQDAFTHTAVSKGTIDTLGEIGTTAADLGQVTSGTGFVIDALENDDVLGALTSGVGVLGVAIDAATDDRGIIDDGLGISEATEGKLSDVGKGLITVSQGVGAGKYILDAAEIESISGIGEGLIDLAELGVERGSALDKGLAVADQALDVVGMAEYGYAPGYSTLFGQLVEVGATAAQLARTPGGGQQVAEPQPTVTVGDGGTRLVDYDNDGVVDAEITVDAQGNRVVGVDIDGDGITDANYVDTDGDGTADALAPQARGLSVGDGPSPDLDRNAPGEIRVNELLPIPEGYSLSELAALHGVSVDEILAVNPQITDPDRIRAGGELVLPEGVERRHAIPERGGDAGTAEVDTITLEELRRGGRQVLLDVANGPVAAVVEVGGDALVGGLDVVGGGDLTPESAAARQRTAARLQQLAHSAVAVGGYVIDEVTGERYFVEDIRDLAFQTLENVQVGLENVSEAPGLGDGEGLVIAGAETVGAVIGGVRPKVRRQKERGEPGSVLDQFQVDGDNGVRRSRVVGIVGSAQDRQSTENVLPKVPRETGLDRAHLAGAGLGLETDVGLGYASVEVNRSIQARVEHHLSDLQSTLRPGEEVRVRVSSETFPFEQTNGKPYLKHIQYEFDVIGGNEPDPPRFALDIEVQADGVPTENSNIVTRVGSSLLDLEIQDN